MLPVNGFKRALQDGQQQIGIWNTVGGQVVAEALATAGYDWILLDTEHSQTDVPDLLGMLQAVAAWPVSAVVRPAANDPVLIKRILDFGAQTLLIPYVQTVEEARAAVAAMRYAPRGVRGVSYLTRASGWGTIADYARRAEAELCLIVQAETMATLGRIGEIAAVDGVDGIFIGPADLAASMGYPGQAGHPEVVAAVEGAIRAIRAAGKPAGILTGDPVFAARCIELGTTFTAVAIDLALMLEGARARRAMF